MGFDTGDNPFPGLEKLGLGYLGSGSGVQGLGFRAWGLGLGFRGLRFIPGIIMADRMTNQLEKNMEAEMDTGLI